ncbi:MAG: LEA type 2 family protein [Gemmatimonadota bacterium]|nr:LEA type 2 family protein [Gemmatimonadota bacterium]
MTGRRMLVMGALALTGLVGCRSLARQAFADPVVEVKDVRVRSIGLQGGSLDVILDVYNPNEYRLDATRITYQVWVDTNQVATGAIDKLVTLTQKGRSDIVVPVDFDVAAVRAALMRFTLAGTLDYRVKGQFTVVTPFGNITRPYSGVGRIDAAR